MNKPQNIMKIAFLSEQLYLLALVGLFSLPSIPIAAQELPKQLHLQVTVNSDLDGAITPDTFLTLREAIELVNGTLSLNRLSAAEKAQVKSLNPNVPSRINFNLPPKQTTIRLNSILPPLVSPGVIVDGKTQPGYATKSGRLNRTFVKELPLPVIAITPAENVEIFRGLTVVADNITVRGISLYGFSAKFGATASTPPADIFIADWLTANETSHQQYLQPALPLAQNQPPQGVVIENNWLGNFPYRVDNSTKKVTVIGIVYDFPRSAFGVSVFNSVGTTIRNNLITNHDGSGIITGKQATNLRISGNVIERNGLAGMPDAIRMEGNIQNTEIISNLIEGNAGSAVFLFKPKGSLQIRNNDIKFNGERFNRAAIYLMGDNHQVTGNQIGNQNGAGVVVAAYPESKGNIIQANRFNALTGLSIDLVTQQNVSVQDYQQGDGVNPPRNSRNRRKETGNAAINAPQFLAREFYILNSKVNIDGVADPGSQIDIYLTDGNNQDYGDLKRSLATVTADAKGRFGVTLSNLKPGERISAIATHPQYGTSEPALNAVVRSLPTAKY
ncbi:right-handed parallel beta-helix repeat-containing protein [Aliterella atlantica]|uniref:right-handed parallel beta-helix repeat-containing protein n=1 Tax=Aliterella atlantica TaxID=1827278 RepID=UPI0006966D5D|nr:right-handed parallel beta-helix repeat-containing protein [Aliterella atlantica]